MQIKLYVGRYVFCSADHVCGRFGYTPTVVRLSSRRAAFNRCCVEVGPFVTSASLDTLTALTEWQEELIRRHGTPVEFAAACHDALGEISVDECNAAIAKYDADFAIAGVAEPPPTDQWEEDKVYPRTAWQLAVATHETQRSYWDWVHTWQERAARERDDAPATA